MSIDPISLFETKPNISSTFLRVEENLSLHYRHDLPGSLEVADGFSHHLITFFLTNNQRQITNLEGCDEYDGQMNQGEFYLYPAKFSGFTSWQEIDKTLHLIIKPSFLRDIAVKTESLNPDRLELIPILKQRDAQIEQLAQLFITEMQAKSFGSQLYLESLANLLGIHLLRNYAACKPVIRQYTDGLADYKLRYTIAYIQSNLDKKISLKVLAEQIGMGRYYFATQFKRAMGISPYQYVVEQRLALAKKLLKARKRSLAEIALDCGFANQSHFSRVFQQYVGTTPKKYQQQ